MFYNYVELEAGTQVAYSNVLDDGIVEVSIERPIELGFDSARCMLQRLSGQTSMASTMRVWRTSIHLSITMPRSFFDWHARRRRTTHRLFLFQGFAFFFWTGEDGEPVHVHVAKGHPSAHATKIWLARNGGCLLASNGSKLTKRELADVMDFVMANHADICRRWRDYFHGVISFYK